MKQKKSVIKDEVSFTMKPDKGYRESGFSFPLSEAKLTDKIIDDLKMRTILTRFAKAVTMQFREQNKRVIGVNISSIGFYFTLQDKE